MINEVVLTIEQREEVASSVEGKTACDGCGKDLTEIRATVGCFSKVKSVIRYVVLCMDCHSKFAATWGKVNAINN